MLQLFGAFQKLGKKKSNKLLLGIFLTNLLSFGQIIDFHKVQSYKTHNGTKLYEIRQ